MRGWWAIFCLAFVAARGPDNWPQIYNNGVEAYRSNDFTAAAQAFEQALPSTDRTVQQRAFYNLGDACYRLGEAQPPQAQQLWQRAIKSYESALALDPNDADARFNRDLVKKKLEELQKQQQQQQNQQSQQDKKQNQNKNDRQQQQKNQNDQQNQQQQKPEDKQSEQQQSKPEQAKQQSQPQSQQEDRPQQASSDNLDKRQAAVLLDDLREDERNWNFFPEVQMRDLKDAGEPAKDW
jgi:Ca-activated chloride channel family protein